MVRWRSWKVHFWSERGTPVLTRFPHKLVYRVVGPAMRRVGRVDHQGLAQVACLAINPPVRRLGPRYLRDTSCQRTCRGME